MFYHPAFALLGLLSLVLSKRYVLLSGGLFILGMIRAIFMPVAPEPIQDVTVRVVGVVAGAPVLTARSQRFELETADRRILVTCRNSRSLAAGDVVAVEGKLEPILNFSPDTDWRRYWLLRGVNQQLTVSWSSAIEVIQPAHGIAAWGTVWRYDTWRRLKSHLSDPQAGVAMGVIAGQQGVVPDEVRDAMIRSGTLHLLATSGFNVMLLAGALVLLLSHLPIPRTFQILLILGLLVAYCYAVGNRPPVVRATLICSLYLGAFLFHRSPDPLSTLAASAIIYLLFVPASFLEPAFQLSYCVVLGLILYVPSLVVWAERYKLRSVRSKTIEKMSQWCVLTFMVSFAAWLWSLPIVVACFGVVPLLGPIANVFTAVAVLPTYIGNFAAQFAGHWSAEFSKGFDILITGTAVSWITWSNQVIANLSWSAFTFEPLPGWVAVLGFAFLVALSHPDKLRSDELSPKAF